MADLYDTTKQNISLHIKNIFDEGELVMDSTVKEFLTVQKEGNQKVEIKYKYSTAKRYKESFQSVDKDQMYLKLYIE